MNPFSILGLPGRSGGTYLLRQFANTRARSLEMIILGLIDHPEAKFLGPDGQPCSQKTRGLLKRASIVGSDNEPHLIGKEVNRFLEGGDNVSWLDGKDEIMSYAQKKLAASGAVIGKLSGGSIRAVAKRTGLSRNTIRKIQRGKLVRRSTLTKVVPGLK